MTKSTILLRLLLILLVVFAAAVSGYAMSCAGGVITIGDRSSDVLAKCGPPDSKESHQEEITRRFDANTKEKLFVTVEEWTYDFGSNQLIRIVTIKNGTVTNIQETRHGTAKP